MVEVTWHLLPAFLAVCSEPYAERLLHAWHLGPAVERVATARVAFLRWCSGGRFNIHAMVYAGLGVRVLFRRSSVGAVIAYNAESTQSSCRRRELHGRRRSRRHARVRLAIQHHPGRTKLLASALTNRGWQSSVLHHVPIRHGCPIQRARNRAIHRGLSKTRRLHRVARRSAPVVPTDLSCERTVYWCWHPAGNAARLHGIWLAVPRAQLGSILHVVIGIHVHIHVNIVCAVSVDHLRCMAKSGAGRGMGHHDGWGRG